LLLWSELRTSASDAPLPASAFQTDLSAVAEQGEGRRDPSFAVEGLTESLELVSLGIDHLSYLKFLLQDTKQTISIFQG
jgi:hypothetical protein